jgi:ribose/xylose/arabinose/galactoside ABC-type transport system permease subunit
MSTRASARTFASRLSRLVLSDYFVLYLCAAYVLVLSFFIPHVLTPSNASNVMSNIWPLLIVAIGQTFVLAIAGIDLSQGAVIGITSVVMAMLIAMTGNPITLDKAPIWNVIISEQGGLLAGMTGGMLLAILMGLFVAVLIGLFNGLAVAHYGMPAFMVTLVTMLMVGSLAIYLPLSENINQLPPEFIQLGKGDIISLYIGAKDQSQIPRKIIYSFVTYPMVVALVVAVVTHFLLNRTVFGRYVFAIGVNRKAAEISGVPVKSVIVAVFIIAAVCAALSSILYSARLEAGRPTLGQGTFLLDVIGAAVIGGTSLFGGKAKIIWTFFGVLFFCVLSNTLNLMNLTSVQVDMVKGAVILSAALLDVWRVKLSQELET